MEISDLLSPDGAVFNLTSSSKKQVLQDLSRRMTMITGLEERKVFDTLLERERLGSTGIGSGIAIPHGKLPGIEGPCGLFARLEKPIDFDAIDDRPVDLIFLLLAPEGAGADHLKALARVSRLLRDQATCAKLRAAESSDALYAILTETASTASAA